MLLCPRCLGAVGAHIYFFRHSDMNFLRSSPVLPFASALQDFMTSCWRFLPSAKQVFMNALRSSPFLPVAPLLQLAISACCVAQCPLVLAQVEHVIAVIPPNGIKERKGLRAQKVNRRRKVRVPAQVPATPGPRRLRHNVGDDR